MTYHDISIHCNSTQMNKYTYMIRSCSGRWRPEDSDVYQEHIRLGLQSKEKATYCYNDSFIGRIQNLGVFRI